MLPLPFFRSLSKPRPFALAIPFLILLTDCSGSGMLSDEEKKGKALVAVHTEYGTMKAELFAATPKHRDNFVELAEEGFYDSTTFHRVIEGFMIQGGDPYTKEEDPGGTIGEGGPGYRIDAEIRDSLFHRKGALAAARKGDQENPERRSSGSQFYIVDGKTFTKSDLEKLEQRKEEKTGEAFSFSKEAVDAYTSEGGAPHLDGAYTVFGQVIEGKSVIDSIASVRTDPSKNRPLDPVRMEVEIIEKP